MENNLDKSQDTRKYFAVLRVYPKAVPGEGLYDWRSLTCEYHPMSTLTQWHSLRIISLPSEQRIQEFKDVFIKLNLTEDEQYELRNKIYYEITNKYVELLKESEKKYEETSKSNDDFKTWNEEKKEAIKTCNEMLEELISSDFKQLKFESDEEIQPE